MVSYHLVEEKVRPPDEQAPDCFVYHWAEPVENGSRAVTLLHGGARSVPESECPTAVASEEAVGLPDRPAPRLEEMLEVSRSRSVAPLVRALNAGQARALTIQREWCYFGAKPGR